MTAALVAAIVVVAVAFDVYCLIDLYRAGAVRYLPKWVWTLICVISIPIGGIVYLTLGRAGTP